MNNNILNNKQRSGTEGDIYWLWPRVSRPISMTAKCVLRDTEWCWLNCTGKFVNSPAGSNFWFENEEDALMFKMAKS